MTTMSGSGSYDPTLADIARRLDSIAVNRMHHRIAWAVGLGLFFDIYEIFLSGAIGTALKTEFAIGGNDLKLVLASAFLGMFFGAAFLSRLADVVGRKRAFMFNLMWFSAWSLIAAFSPDPWFLILARFLAGVGVGAEYPVADSYLSDVLPKRHLGRLAAWTYTCSFVAVPFVGFLSLALTGHELIGIDGWRILLALGALGAFLVTMMRRALPESPRWLASRGRTEEAYRALEQIESGFPTTDIDRDEHVEPITYTGYPASTAATLDQRVLTAVDASVPAATRHAVRIPHIPNVRVLRLWHTSRVGLDGEGLRRDLVAALYRPVLPRLPGGIGIGDPPAQTLRTQAPRDCVSRSDGVVRVAVRHHQQRRADRRLRLPNHRNKQRIFQCVSRVSG